MVTTYHPALSSMVKVVQKLHPMLKSTEEHRRIFSEPPFMAFRGCKNLKDILVRSKLYNVDNGVCDNKGCNPCRKSRCQVCKVMCSATTFTSRVTSKEYRINFSFNCDLSNVAYMLECSICGVQCAGSTSFRVRFNTYKPCNRRFNGGASGVPQAAIFRHFAGEGHRGLLEDVRIVILDKLYGNGRKRESFWQYKMDTFVPRGLNIRQVDCCS